MIRSIINILLKMPDLSGWQQQKLFIDNKKYYKLAFTNVLWGSPISAMMRVKSSGEWMCQGEVLLSLKIIFNFANNNHHTCGPFSKYDWHLPMSYLLSSVFPLPLLQLAII